MEIVYLICRGRIDRFYEFIFKCVWGLKLKVLTLRNYIFGYDSLRQLLDDAQSNLILIIHGINHM